MLEHMLLSIPDLIEMAVSPNEINLNLLNAVLQIIASQSAVNGVRVQLSTDVPVIHRGPQRSQIPNTFTVFTVEDASPDGQLDLKTCRLVPHPIDTNKQVNTLVVMDHACVVPQPYLNNDLVEKSLPTASQLVATCRNDEGRTLLQMLDLLNIAKRLEAAELSIEKVMSLVCELCKSMKSKGPAVPARPSGGIIDISPSTQMQPDRSAIVTVKQDPSVFRSEPSLLHAPRAMDYESMRTELYELQLEFKDLTELVHGLQDLPFRFDRLVDVIETNTAIDIHKDSISGTGTIITNTATLVSDLERRIAKIEQRCACATSPATSSTTAFSEKPEDVPKEDDVWSEIISPMVNFNLDDVMLLKKEHDDLMLRVINVESSICTLQNELVRLFAHLEDHGKFAKSMRCQLLDFIQTFEELRHNVHGLNVDVNMLVQERKDRMRQYEALIDQMEQIKCIKADREEVEQMVVVKADITDMRTKVSFSQFEDVKKDMSLSLIDALEKIIETDLEWNRAIESIHELLLLKLDKVEASHLADDMTSRMIALKDKLRGFGMFRLSCESAATSEKYIKDVKCIACNAQTYMKPTLSLPRIPKLAKFGRSTDPAVKKFSRITVPCSMRQEIKEPHTVLRYCGGLHTRVANGEKHSVKGNFIVQTGAVPLHPNVNVQLECGTDGVLYRVDVSDCNCGDS